MVKHFLQFKFLLLNFTEIQHTNFANYFFFKYFFTYIKISSLYFFLCSVNILPISELARHVLLSNRKSKNPNLLSCHLVALQSRRSILESVMIQRWEIREYGPVAASARAPIPRAQVRKLIGQIFYYNMIDYEPIIMHYQAQALPHASNISDIASCMPRCHINYSIRSLRICISLN